MNWKETIEKGMKLIEKGCKEQTEWTKCHECPFKIFCDAIEANDYDIPSEEFSKGEEDF